MVELHRPDVFRQSLLRGFTVCARRTMHGLTVDEELPLGWVEDRGDLGSAFHAFAAEYLRTLWRQGEAQMPTQEAVEVMVEVMGRLDFALSGEAMDELRYLVLGFCEIEWQPTRILALEETLLADIVCAGGEVLTLKGQPDVLLADPPHGLIVADWKTGRGRPRGPRIEPETGEIVEDEKYLSEMFQLRTYALLALRRYPTARYVIGREYHLRSGQIRQGRWTREGLEHAERQLAELMGKLDRAISEGEGSELWAPRSGGHCNRQCPVVRSCPIPMEMRGDGALATVDDANEAARALAVLEGQRSALIGQLKAWVESPVNPLPHANENEVAAWKPPTGRGRRFGLWRREDVFESQERAA